MYTEHPVLNLFERDLMQLEIINPEPERTEFVGHGSDDGGDFGHSDLTDDPKEKLRIWDPHMKIKIVGVFWIISIF